jgi:hypothetical protein
MAIPLCLNDLSCKDWPESIEERVSFIVQLAKVLTEVKKLRRESYLLAEARIGELLIGGVTLASFFSNGHARDSIRVILAFSNASPYESFGEVGAGGFECNVAGRSGKGLLFATLLNTSTVSFASAPQWKSADISVVLEELDEIEGAVQITREQRQVTNIASVDHVAIHKRRLLEFGIESVASAEEIWAKKSDLFPSLRFLSRIERQIYSVCADNLVRQQVMRRLVELERTAREWDPQLQQFPEWCSKVTPEAEQRKRLCEFVDDDGITRCYDLHARYTPGAGRIHFRLVPEVRTLEIGYIGPKL